MRTKTPQGPLRKVYYRTDYIYHWQKKEVWSLCASFISRRITSLLSVARLRQKKEGRVTTPDENSFLSSSTIPPPIAVAQRRQKGSL